MIRRYVLLPTRDAPRRASTRNSEADDQGSTASASQLSDAVETKELEPCNPRLANEHSIPTGAHAEELTCKSKAHKRSTLGLAGRCWCRESGLSSPSPTTALRFGE